MLVSSSLWELRGSLPVLFTHLKTSRRKKFQEGTLNVAAGCVELLDASGRPLEQETLSAAMVQRLAFAEELDFPGHLIQPQERFMVSGNAAKEVPTPTNRPPTRNPFKKPRTVTVPQVPATEPPRFANPQVAQTAPQECAPDPSHLMYPAKRRGETRTSCQPDTAAASRLSLEENVRSTPSRFHPSPHGHVAHLSGVSPPDRARQRDANEGPQTFQDLWDECVVDVRSEHRSNDVPWNACDLWADCMDVPDVRLQVGRTDTYPEQVEPARQGGGQKDRESPTFRGEFTSSGSVSGGAVVPRPSAHPQEVSSSHPTFSFEPLVKSQADISNVSTRPPEISHAQVGGPVDSDDELMMKISLDFPPNVSDDDAPLSMMVSGSQALSSTQPRLQTRAPARKRASAKSAQRPRPARNAQRSAKAKKTANTVESALPLNHFQTGLSMALSYQISDIT